MSGRKRPAEDKRESLPQNPPPKRRYRRRRSPTTSQDEKDHVICIECGKRIKSNQEVVTRPTRPNSAWVPEASWHRNCLNLRLLQGPRWVGQACPVPTQEDQEFVDEARARELEQVDWNEAASSH